MERGAGVSCGEGGRGNDGFGGLINPGGKGGGSRQR